MLPYDNGEIDLLSAVDIAIRDLREMTSMANATAQTRARECLSMLEDAYAVATRS